MIERNYATWGAALVIDNEQETQYRAHAMARACLDSAPLDPNVRDGIWTIEQTAQYRLATLLKDFIEELCRLGEDDEPSMMAQQLLRAAIGDIDLDDLAAQYLGEIEES